MMVGLPAYTYDTSITTNDPRWVSMTLEIRDRKTGHENVLRRKREFLFKVTKEHILKQASHDYLVVSTHLKNISQIGSSPQVGVKIKNL